MMEILSGDPVSVHTPSAAGAFDYDKAFASNIGWVTESEQKILKGKRVAIAGVGGVGGGHLLTLARLGISRFRIADLDRFELHNFNRQAGATLNSLGRHKVETLTEMALAINPKCELDVYSSGVQTGNLQTFFEGVDLYVDGLDFFAFPIREAVFSYCAQNGIPAITVAPLGMSAALLNFLPGHMTFEEYFQLAGHTDVEKAIRFAVGLAPGLLQRGYLVDPSRLNLREHRGPSTIMACQLCAGIAGTEALKILLGRGKVWAAPHGIQFDAYTNRMTHTWRPGGNRNPLNRLAISIAKRTLGVKS